MNTEHNDIINNTDKMSHGWKLLDYCFVLQLVSKYQQVKSIEGNGTLRSLCGILEVVAAGT